MSFFRKRIDKLRYLWRMALEESADPKKFAFALAVGTVVSASPVPPVLGLRSASALGAAWLTKCSKLAAFLSSHVMAGPLWVLCAMVEVRIGSFLLRRPPPTWGATGHERLEAARHALLAWWIGGVLFAPLCGLVAYAIALPIARRYRARKERLAAQEQEKTPGDTPPDEERT